MKVPASLVAKESLDSINSDVSPIMFEALCHPGSAIVITGKYIIRRINKNMEIYVLVWMTGGGLG